MIRLNYDKTTGKLVGINKNNLPYIEIDEKAPRPVLPDKYSYYAVENNTLVVKRNEPTEEEKARDAARAKNKRLIEISKWLKANDWKVNKVFLGEWETTDPRWTEYLTTRAALRAEHERLTKEV